MIQSCVSSQAFATVFVTVLDRNDNTPKFSQAMYTGDIMENSIAGTSVNMVSTDKPRDNFLKRNEFMYTINLFPIG